MHSALLQGLLLPIIAEQKPGENSRGQPHNLTFSWRPHSILALLCSLWSLEEWSVQNYSLYTSWLWKEVFGLSFSNSLKSSHLFIFFCFGLLAHLTCSQCVINADWSHSEQTEDRVACISCGFLTSLNLLHVPLTAPLSQLESPGNLFNRKYKLYKSWQLLKLYTGHQVSFCYIFQKQF